MKDEIQREINRLERVLELIHQGRISEAQTEIYETQSMLRHLKEYGIPQG